MLTLQIFYRKVAKEKYVCSFLRKTYHLVMNWGIRFAFFQAFEISRGMMLLSCPWALLTSRAF